jgi:hypothetical protein
MAQAAYKKLITSQKLKKIKMITDQDTIRPKYFAPVQSQAFRSSLILVTPKVDRHSCLAEPLLLRFFLDYDYKDFIYIVDHNLMVGKQKSCPRPTTPPFLKITPDVMEGHFCTHS